MLQEKSTGLRGYPILGSRSYACSANYSFTIIFSIRVSIMRPSGWPHKKTPSHFMDSPPEWCQVGFGPPVYRHTLATHGNSEWTAFMSFTRTRNPSTDPAQKATIEP